MTRIVECWSDSGKPRAIEMDQANRAYGWVYYKHADGHWVTLRKATEKEMESAKIWDEHNQDMPARCGPVAPAGLERDEPCYCIECQGNSPAPCRFGNDAV